MTTAAGTTRERSHGRGAGDLRPVTIQPGFVPTATGSALISCGETRVICTASIQESVPRWMAGRGSGWVTAEYGMLPASTGDRKARDISKGRADGRTRCASITGGYVALELAFQKLVAEGKLERAPLTGSLAAVSCGIVDGTPLLDLDYAEDSTAEVDANVVMTGDGGLVEVQATAERTPLSRAHLDELLALAQHGIEGLRAAQAAVIG